jgi:hypothetical protein
MGTGASLTLTALVTVGAYAAFRVVTFVRRTSPLSDLPGPPNPSWLLGNIKQIAKDDELHQHEKWVQEYGPVMRYYNLFGVPLNPLDMQRALTLCTAPTAHRNGPEGYHPYLHPRQRLPEARRDARLPQSHLRRGCARR